MFVKIIEITNPELVENLCNSGWSKFSLDTIKATIVDAHNAKNEQDELFSGVLFQKISDYSIAEIGESVAYFPSFVSHDEPFWQDYSNMLTILEKQVRIDNPRNARKGTMYNCAKWEKIIQSERRKTERTKKAMLKMIKKYNIA